MPQIIMLHPVNMYNSYMSVKSRPSKTVEENKSGTVNVAQLVDGLPSLENALDLVPSVAQTHFGGDHLSSRTGVLEARGSEAQGYLGVQSRYEVSLNYTRMCLLKTNQ